MTRQTNPNRLDVNYSGDITFFQVNKMVTKAHKKRNGVAPDVSHALSDFDPERQRWKVMSKEGDFLAIVAASGEVVLAVDIRPERDPLLGEIEKSFWNEESPPGNPERQSDADEAHTPEPEENERSTE